MRKLRLGLDDLKVESFDVLSPSVGVFGHEILGAEAFAEPTKTCESCASCLTNLCGTCDCSEGTCQSCYTNQCGSCTCPDEHIGIGGFGGGPDV
jgi:hypothetical protein